MSRRPFFSNCVSWCSSAPLEVLEWLCDNAEDISFDELKGQVDIADLEGVIGDLGYASEGEAGLKIEVDHHVRFKRERRSGVPFIVHSAIEYVFATPEDIERIQGYIDMDEACEP